MGYAPPTAETLTFRFTTDTVYQPPTNGAELLFRFSATGDTKPPIYYPVPPSLILTTGTSWKAASTKEQTKIAVWQQSGVVDRKALLFSQAAQELSPSKHKIGWNTIPGKDRRSGSLWSEPVPEDKATESRWGQTTPTDPSSLPIPWDKSAQPKARQTTALWGQPPAKDQRYTGPWFRVDTISAPKPFNDRRNPPLWADTANHLGFSFADRVYLPEQVPDLWFPFESRITPHPIQAKEGRCAVVWQPARRINLSPGLPWGEGRSEQVKDSDYELNYGGEVEPLPPEPEPPPVEEKECYLLMNSVNAIQLPDEEPLALLNITIELDIDSFCWQLSATVANRAVLARIAPDHTGTKDVKVTINGWDWIFMVTRYTAERSFNNERYRIYGESRTRLLSAPYAPLRSKTEDQAISAVQAATAELTNTGFTLQWDATEALATPDWVLPSGLFSYVEQTPMQVIARLATTAGAVVIPVADTDALAVQPRYRVSPWAWEEETTSVDHAIPESMILSLSLEWRPAPAYNAVYVSGINEGVAVEVQRKGSAGDEPAPDIIEEWLTTSGVNTERGRNVLSEGGDQAVVTMELPLTARGQHPGLVLPGRLVKVLEGESAWVGLCLSTRITSVGSGAGRVAQTLALERHYE